MLDVHPNVLAELHQIGASTVRLWRYSDFATPITSPSDLASAIGLPVGRVAKTMIVAEQQADDVMRRLDPGRHLCAVLLPSPAKIDMKAVAGTYGWKRAELAQKEQVLDLFGYPSGSVSPFGLQKIAVLIDTALFAYPTVVTGAGKFGVELEIDTSMLWKIGQPLQTRARATQT
ncbi:hypothetical protein B5K08_23635 [Rhizobium leguminosarum bv. trifolii]|uniref:Prolyl-tRNA editing enzyme YbaK/EbsC (Cys-tRNA(Pro) deacylase) n=3 Tax=Rhizobium TaxID=379 RepID=A0A7W8XJF9_9HYPH|nr:MULTISPECIES: YbaK/EbsC family protein [Rhizobium]KPH04695.1 hypothetical protein AOG23_31850 [Rhizobium acidisoli]MBB4576777.1 prolyl-tRNA editing enzyme YbaK/EbsC (Cys-tRNA(Pro) deacylase) [Rhizobium lentis]MBB5553188.1 prolyl-tRNA editing enzyme YbaK/EbsC (Cys-tRNA(Pro) deacylase) [Rhizobium lentis]MBB5563975.1 prolyl-tRNA editing enzyme YbaK/EbsC (Cys-tRNA(Pro) deacylase) [Rhizobium lentis]MBB5570287.1 prolyl-tRNA editing enzyme YbaK/EbsC (Cys-tRNA(Pro) deacylase) [Rhizobium lentis]